MSAFSRRTFLAGVAAMLVPPKLLAGRRARPGVVLPAAPTSYELPGGGWHRVEAYCRNGMCLIRVGSKDGLAEVRYRMQTDMFYRQYFAGPSDLVASIEGDGILWVERELLS